MPSSLFIGSIFTALALLALPICGLISSRQRKHWENVLTGTGAYVGFLGFLFLSGAAIYQSPDVALKMAFILIFGVGNALLWPYMLGRLASTKEHVLYWFGLSIFPVLSLSFLIFTVHSIGFLAG